MESRFSPEAVISVLTTWITKRSRTELRARKKTLICGSLLSWERHFSIVRDCTSNHARFLFFRIRNHTRSRAPCFFMCFVFATVFYNTLCQNVMEFCCYECLWLSARFIINEKDSRYYALKNATKLRLAVITWVFLYAIETPKIHKYHLNKTCDTKDTAADMLPKWRKCYFRHFGENFSNKRLHFFYSHKFYLLL